MKCTSSVWPRHIALLGGHSESSPPNQLPVPLDANWFCITGNFPEQRQAIPDTRLRLRSSRTMASPLQHHGAYQQSPRLVRGRRRFAVAWEGQRAHGYGLGISGAIFRRPGFNQAPSYSAMLQHFYSSGATFLVSTSWLARLHGVQRNVD